MTSRDSHRAKPNRTKPTSGWMSMAQNIVITEA